MTGIAKISELKDGDTGVNLMCTIESKEDVRDVNTKFGETKVCTCKVKDESGSMKFTLWGKDTQKAVGDAINDRERFCKYIQGRITIEQR